MGEPPIGAPPNGSYFFYCPSLQAARATLPLPNVLKARFWTPGFARMRPPGGRGASWPIWWLFHQARMFGNRNYAVLVISDRKRLVHRAGVFPPYFRFPFMSADDLQIGDVWTEAEWRGQGLARWSIAQIVSVFERPGRQFWYVTSSANVPSCKAAERAGLVCVGTGRRVPRLGLRALGAFVIDAPGRVEDI